MKIFVKIALSVAVGLTALVVSLASFILLPLATVGVITINSIGLGLVVVWSIFEKAKKGFKIFRLSVKLGLKYIGRLVLRSEKNQPDLDRSQKQFLENKDSFGGCENLYSKVD